MSQDKNQISRVTRSKEDARISYDRMSNWYDLIAGSSEWKFVKIGLELLNAAEGEVILESGFGTGKALLSLAHSVGETGRVYGLDLSKSMFNVASHRIERSGLSDRVDLRCGDAATLPFEDHSFDAVFTSFTLELFDTPEIPVVLGEYLRVLREGGRLGLVAMSKQSVDAVAVRLYEWAHEKFPNFVDCRPIYVSESLKNAGLQVIDKKAMMMWGLPVDIILARKL